MINLLLSVALVAVGSAFVLIPLDESSGQQSPGEKNAGLSKIMPPENEPLSAYSAICQRELRKPLFDAKVSVVSTAKAPPPKPKLAVTLTGTVIEPGFTYAMLRGKSGQVKFVSVGQVIDDAEVTEITSSSVTVKFHGDSITLKVSKGGR